MEVVAPAPEFHFHTAVDAPSSPPNPLNNNSSFFQFHHPRHVSAPSSPTHSAAYHKPAAAAAAAAGSRHLSVPFDWEEKPGTPKSPSFDEKDADFDSDYSDFSFAFSDRSADKVPQPPPPAASPEKTAAATMVAADESFELVKVRPLKLPPRFYAPVMGEQGAKSPKSVGFLSPLRRGRNQRGKEFDPFVVAMVEATRSRRASRSLSPFGGRKKGGIFRTTPSSLPSHPPPMAEKSGKGWKSRLKELLLFRSSSEGRVRGERKNNDFHKYGSSSSSSSNSSVGSGNVKTGFGGVAGGGGGGASWSEESGSKWREAAADQEMECRESRMVVAVEKKAAAPYKLNIILRSFNAGKFAASFSFIRRRT